LRRSTVAVDEISYARWSVAVGVHRAEAFDLLADHEQHGEIAHALFE
jgi:hypothetical protein